MKLIINTTFTWSLFKMRNQEPCAKISKKGKYTVSLVAETANGSNMKTMSNYITVKR